MNRRTSIPTHIALLGSFFLGLSLSGKSLQADEPATEALAGIPLNWVTENIGEVNETVERLGNAYSLSADRIEALRAELVSKLSSQWAFERSSMASAQELADQLDDSGEDENSEIAIKLREQLRVWSSMGPINDLAIAPRIESELPPDSAAAGRARLTELLDRRIKVQLVQDADMDAQAAHNGQLASQSAGAMAPESVQGTPLPRGKKLVTIAPEVVGKTGGASVPLEPVSPNKAPSEVNTIGATLNNSEEASATVGETKQDLRHIQAAADALLSDPGKEAVATDRAAKSSNGRTAKASAIRAGNVASAVAPTPASTEGKKPPVSREVATPTPDKGPSRAMPAAVEPVRLQAAPPLDDWDKYVDTTCKKFAFSDAQVIKAQSILKDLRTRAAGYRSSRNEDFAAAERISDAKAKADRKKELSAPIDAFFEELKQRLDNLATLEQRAKASSPPSPGKK